MKDKVVEYIQLDKLEEAIIELDKSIEDRQSFLELFGQYTKYKNDCLAGVLSYDQETIQRNRIRRRIIELYNSSIKFQSDFSIDFIDERDGQIYRAIKILDKYWFTEDLRYQPTEKIWKNQFTHYKWPNNEVNHYYAWNCAMYNCPKGWRLPTIDEWKDLAMHFGGYRIPKSSGLLLADILLSKTTWGDTGNDPERAYMSLTYDGKSGLSLENGGYYSKYAYKDPVWLKREPGGEGVGVYWSQDYINGDIALSMCAVAEHLRLFPSQFTNTILGSVRCIRDI